MLYVEVETLHLCCWLAEKQPAGAGLQQCSVLVFSVLVLCSTICLLCPLTLCPFFPTTPLLAFVSVCLFGTGMAAFSVYLVLAVCMYASCLLPDRHGQAH